GTEAAKLDAIAPRHGIPDLVEDGVDDVLDIALEQMRIFRREFLDEFRLDHPWLQLRSVPAPWSGARANLPKRNQPVKRDGALRQAQCCARLPIEEGPDEVK